MTILNNSKLQRLAQMTKTEEDFIKEAMRFWHWYMTPEMRWWTKEHLRKFYSETKGISK